MSFTQGLSGLDAASKDLEVIGNNVANVNTVGFKSSQAQFADVFAASLGGAGSSQIGLGTKLAAVAQQFTQGNITSTNNPLDMAINGPGFFVLHGVNGTGYSRNGQFQVDKNGNIVTSTGQNLQGWPAANGIVANSGPTANLNISTASIPPLVTSSIAINMNVDSRSTPIPAATVFDPAQPTTYTSSTSTTVYDSLGNARQNTLYFQNTGGSPDVWNVYATVADPNAKPTTPQTFIYPAPPPVTIPPTPQTYTSIGALSFDTTSGTLTTPANGQIALPSFAPQFPNGLTYNFTGSTEYGATFAITKMTVNGYTTGQLVGYAASADGTITGQYSNGQTQLLGQVALATFAANQALQPLGNNEWAATTASGPALVAAPGAGLNGVLQTSSVEGSNVDLTTELVSMITAQRNYQANSQTIKTQDTIFQTLINLR